MLSNECSQTAKGRRAKHHRCTNTRLEHAYGMISEVTAAKLRLQQEWGILHGESMHVAQQIDTFLSVNQVENAETRTPAYNTAWLETPPHSRLSCEALQRLRCLWWKSTSCCFRQSKQSVCYVSSGNIITSKLISAHTNNARNEITIYDYEHA